MTAAGWILWLLLGAFLEGLALAGHGAPLTDTIRAIRFDPIGRYAILTMTTWLAWHFALRPKSIDAFTWRDVVAILAGIAWAVLDGR